MTGKLIVIPTPIGNLGDITLRALDALKTVNLLLCEDTRHTLTLLRHYEIEVPLLSYHKFNERERSEQAIRRIEQGESIGLVSDAGLPGISDPGEILIADVVAAGLPVEVLPGANAAITALVGSGLPVLPFLMIGFMSRDNRVRRQQWEQIENTTATIVLYESPKRIRKTLQQLYDKLGNRKISIGRELTKLHEEYIRGDLETLLAAPESIKEKGEMAVVIGPAIEGEKQGAESLLREALQDMPLSKAVRQVAKVHGIPKNELYTLGLTLTEESQEDES